MLFGIERSSGLKQRMVHDAARLVHGLTNPPGVRLGDVRMLRE